MNIKRFFQDFYIIIILKRNILKSHIYIIIILFLKLYILYCKILK